MTVEHHEFASDNTAPICPEAWAALQEANTDYAAAYGEDRWTARVCDRIREIFEVDCDVYFVFTGTAANALALAQLCRSFRSIICHRNAHIQTDECGAPEFFTSGSKLLLVGGGNGSPQRVRPMADKIDIGQTESLLMRQNELHSHKPGVISIAQATEFGTVYTPNEIAAVAGLARRMNCLCTWTVRVSRTQSRRSNAHQKRSHGKLASMFCASAGQKMGPPLAS